MSVVTSDARTLYVWEAGGYRPATLEEMVQAARQALAQKFRRGRRLSSMALVRDYLQIVLAPKAYEVFCLLLLDSKEHVLEFTEVFRGTLDMSSVHPREVVRDVLQYNAAAVILVHNHPSGIAEASHADELVTQRLKTVLALIDVRVIDHLVVGANDVFSFAEHGLL